MDTANRQWFLNAGTFTYVVGINNADMPQILYWGLTLPAAERMQAKRRGVLLQRSADHGDAA
ncbi:MAG: hypothetical protein ACRYFU_04670 [Janthinobacterium lividum]